MFRLLVFVTLPLAAQTNDPLSTEIRTAYTTIKTNLIKMAERMPEEHFGFKPTPELQNFQQRMAHIADANVRTCSAMQGTPKRVGAAAKTAKADLMAALKESFISCDAAFNPLTDVTAVQMVPGEIGSPPATSPRTRLSTLWNVVRHSNEMYGYMSVYLRLKGIVPPSTAPD